MVASASGPPAPPLPRLRPKQELALAAILAGATDGEAASRAGVARETLNRWKHADANFVAELNRRRAEAWEASCDALRALAPKAVRALSDALDAPSPTTRLRAASLVLKTLGVAAEPLRPASGPSDPDGVERRWEAARRVEEESKALGAMLAPFRMLG